MSLMKKLFDRSNLTTKRDRRSRTASHQRCRRALALEPLEGRALLSVSNLDITSIASAADTDGGVGGAEHVAVPAGSTVTINFSYDSTANIATTAKFDVDTSPTTVSTSETTVPSGTGRTASLSLVIPIGTTPGSYNAHVQVKNDNGNGSVSNDSDANSVVVTIPINVVTEHLSINVGNTTYNGAAYSTSNITPTLVPGGASGAVTYTFYSDAGGTTAILPPTNAGTYYVRGHFASSDTSKWTNADSSIASFTIAKADATISVNGYTGVYDGQAHGATGTASGVQGEDLSGLLDLGATYINAGSYTASWSFAGNTNYNPAGGTVAIEIAKADATISVSGYTGVYDGQAHGATGTATGVNGEDLSGLLNLGATYTNAGSYTTDWSFAGNTNYNPAGGTVAIEIAKADATIVVNGYSGTYDGQAHGATGTARGVNGEDLSGLLDLGATYINAGSHTASWSFAGNTNYNPASGDVTIVIAKADTTMTLNAQKTPITDSSIRFTATLSCPTTIVNEGTIAFVSVLNASGQQVAYATVGVGSGSASVDFDLPAGVYTVTATYGETVDFKGSSDSGVLTLSYTDGAITGFVGGGLGYWSNKNGLKLVSSGDLVALNGLYLANASGTDVTVTANTLASYLQGATATNMSYMLAAQMVAAKLDVLHTAGLGSTLVDATSLLNFTQFASSGVLANGFISVDNLISAANDALKADHSAISGDVNRAYQEALKNLLEKVAGDGSVFLSAMSINW
jgi:hypothetical protein